MGSEMLRMAVVGLGWWGSRLVQALQDSRLVRPVIGVDPDPEVRARLAAAADIPIAERLEDIVERDDVDAVALCSPHEFHAEQALMVAKSRKHLFVEKPFAGNASDAHRVLMAAEFAGVRVGVGHERRFEPPVQHLLERCRGGDLGRLMRVEGNFSHDRFLKLPPDNWRLSARHAPVGPLSATGIHLVDLSIAVLGTPRRVFASLASLATEFENGDSLSAVIEFDSGAVATLTAVLATPFQGRFCVFGSEQWTEIADRTHPDASEGWDVNMQKSTGPKRSEFIPPIDAVRANLESFAGSVRGEGLYPITGDEILSCAATFDAIGRSALSGHVELVESTPAGVAPPDSPSWQAKS